MSDYHKGNHKDVGLRRFLIGLFIVVFVIFLGVGISKEIQRRNDLKDENYALCIQRELRGMGDQNCEQYLD